MDRQTRLKRSAARAGKDAGATKLMLRNGRSAG
jgi:hypothetical protein